MTTFSEGLSCRRAVLLGTLGMSLAGTTILGLLATGIGTPPVALIDWLVVLPGVFFLFASSEILITTKSARSIVWSVLCALVLATLVGCLSLAATESVGLKYSRSKPQPAALAGMLVFVVLHLSTLTALRFALHSARRATRGDD